MNQSNAICARPRRKAYLTRKKHFSDGVNDLLEDEGSDWPDKAIKARRPMMKFEGRGRPPASTILQTGARPEQAKREKRPFRLFDAITASSSTVQVVWYAR